MYVCMYVCLYVDIYVCMYVLCGRVKIFLAALPMYGITYLPTYQEKLEDQNQWTEGGGLPSSITHTSTYLPTYLPTYQEIHEDQNQWTEGFHPL